MNVVHFISSPSSGGAEILVRDLAIQQKIQGDVSPVVVFLNNASYFGRSLDFEAFFLRQLDKYSIPYFFINKNARRNPLVGWLSAFKLFFKIKPDIVHAHLFYGLIFSLLTPLRFKLVYTHHNIVVNAPKWLFYMFDLRVSKYIGISRVCSITLRTFTRRPVVTIFNAVDRNRISPIPSDKNLSHDSVQDEQYFRILMVGRLSEQKNYQLIINSLSYLHDKNIIVNIVGEGPHFEIIKRDIESRKLCRVVNLLGARTDVPDLMREHDLFAMSSLWEGLPIALIEATMCGLPCVVTDVGGCSEIVDICKSGLVVKSTDSIEYSAALKSMIEDNVLRSNCSRNALENSKVFEIENSSAKHYALYVSII